MSTLRSEKEIWLYGYTNPNYFFLLYFLGLGKKVDWAPLKFPILFPIFPCNMPIFRCFSPMKSPAALSNFRRIPGSPFPIAPSKSGVPTARNASSLLLGSHDSDGR